MQKDFSQKGFHKRGAEAELSVGELGELNVLSKKRVPKGYRNKELDLEIRKKRTKGEAKLLKEASCAINVPKIFSVDEEKSEIILELIPAQPLKFALEKKTALCAEAGKQIKKLHDRGIIHGDLTTSNILYLEHPKDDEIKARVKKKGPLFFIDFGLGYFSTKIEDKAVDLVVFKKTFNATHSSLTKGWKKVLEGYAPDAELTQRMKEIEKRARYH